MIIEWVGAVGRWNTLRGGVFEDPRRLSQLLFDVNLYDTLQSWSRVQPRGLFYILHYKIIFPSWIFFRSLFLVKLLFGYPWKQIFCFWRAFVTINIQLLESPLILSLRSLFIWRYLSNAPGWSIGHRPTTVKGLRNLTIFCILDSARLSDAFCQTQCCRNK